MLPTVSFTWWGSLCFQYFSLVLCQNLSFLAESFLCVVTFLLDSADFLNNMGSELISLFHSYTCFRLFFKVSGLFLKQDFEFLFLHFSYFIIFVFSYWRNMGLGMCYRGLHIHIFFLFLCCDFVCVRMDVSFTFIFWFSLCFIL